MGLFGTDESDVDQRAVELADRALGPSVTGERLTNTETGFGRVNYLSEASILELLGPEELPQAVLSNLKAGITKDGNDFNSNGNYQHFLVVTDSRLLFLVGNKSGDRGNAIEYDDILEVTVSTGLLKQKLTVESSEGIIEFRVAKSTADADELHSLRDYVRRRNGDGTEDREPPALADHLDPIWIDTADPDVSPRHAGGEAPSRADPHAGSRYTSAEEARGDISYVTDIYVSKLVDKSMGQLVTRARLTEQDPGITHSQTLGEAPPIEYLVEDEIPHFLFRVDEMTIGDETLRPDHGGYLVATDHRVVLLIGHAGRDALVTIPYESITSIRMKAGLNSRKFFLESGIGTFVLKGSHSYYNESGVSSDEELDLEFKSMVQFVKEAVYRTL